MCAALDFKLYISPYYRYTPTHYYYYYYYYYFYSCFYNLTNTYNKEWNFSSEKQQILATCQPSVCCHCQMEVNCNLLLIITWHTTNTILVIFFFITCSWASFLHRSSIIPQCRSPEFLSPPRGRSTAHF
jgi:hypothetical protein